jgi:hypothetical protein
VARAREEFASGSVLAHQGQWSDALASFERSLRLRPHPVTVYNIAYCERALGRFTRARKSFMQALTGTAGAERLPEDVALDARTYLAEVERRIVRITVLLSAGGTRLAVDGRPLETSRTGDGSRVLVAGTRALGPGEVVSPSRFDVLLDPGRHLFVISRTGEKDVMFEREVTAGMTELRLPATADATRTRTHAGSRQTEEARDYTPAVIAYGVAATGLATGALFGVAALKKSSDLADACPEPDRCPRESQRDIDAGKRYALISNLGFGVALLGGGVGTYLLLSAEPRGDLRSGSPRLAANAGLGWVSVRASF